SERQTAVGKIVNGAHATVADEGKDVEPGLLFQLQIDMGGGAFAAAEHVAQIGRLAEMGAPFSGRTDQDDGVAFAGETGAGHSGVVLDEADAGDGRGGQDAPT